MQMSQNSDGRWLRSGLFLPLVLLALPNCALQTGGLGPPPVFDPGPGPQTSAIMCDIPKVPAPDGGRCANSTEIGIGMPAEYAAVALAQGEQNSLALDFSDAAELECDGHPRKIEYQGAFPDGYAVCLNCGTQMPVPYPDANAACVAQCIDLVNHGGTAEPPEGAEKFCKANAHVSTNFDPSDCYADACSGGGTLRPDFVDPRRAQEPVVWTDLVGASATGNDLTRTLPGAGSFDAGGASKQTFSHGDGWVEFEAGENDVGHYIGLTPDVGADVDPTQADIAFGLRLGMTGKVFIVEKGAAVGSQLATYVPGDRFRVQLKDNFDGTATVSYFQLNGPCVPGTACSTLILGSSVTHAAYPLRVDASLGGQGATLKNVTLVRIK